MDKSNLKAKEFKLSQVFGSEQASNVCDEDIISCLKFDPTGEYLCLGDYAGRVIVFRAPASNPKQHSDYEYYSEFQSHVREFDQLKGIECSEKIVDISWLRPQGKYLKLLTTNSKSIKFWKAHEKVQKKLAKAATKELGLPKIQSDEPAFRAKEQYIFPCVHSTEINSLSHSSNEQYVLSTDQEQSFLWSLEKPTRPYIANSIVNRRNTTTNELSITCSKMHPRSDSLFVFGLNRCELGLCDVRTSGIYAKVMQFGIQARSMKNFFTDMVATVGGAEFLSNGRYIVSRQYLSVKVWDIMNTNKPLHSIYIQQSMKSKLVSLFQSDNILDKFSLSSSADSSTIVTGNYNNNFHSLNFENGVNTQYQLNFEKKTMSKQIPSVGKCPPIEKMDTKRKTSVVAYHPICDRIAVASLNSFFVYNA